MKKIFIFILLFCTIAMVITPLEALCTDKSIFQIGAQTMQSMQIQFKLPDFEIKEETINGKVWNKVIMEDVHYLVNPGMPELPVITTTIAIPYRGQVQVNVNNPHIRTIRHIIPYPAQDGSENSPKNLLINQDFYHGTTIYPQESIRYSDPQILRDFRIITLQVLPFAWNSQTQELLVRDQMDINLIFNNEPGLNEMSPPQCISSVWENIYAANILNFDDYRNLLVANTPPKIVMIYGAYNDATFQTKIQNFALWKKQKGADVRLVSTATTGYTNTAIKAYLQNLYNDITTRPDFIVLIGDTTGNFSIPTWQETMSTYQGKGDYPYQHLAGNDYVGDCFLGRISAENVSDLDIILSKIYYYEKTINVDQAQWLNKMLLVGDPSSSGMSTIYVNTYVKGMALVQNPDYTFSEVYSGPFPSAIDTAINQGVGFMNYRGYIGMSGWSPGSSLVNGTKLPHAVIITCSTGNFAGETATTENFIRLGTASVPKGAVTAIGMYTSGTHTGYNNAICVGIWQGLLNFGMRTMGEALLNGKITINDVYGVTHELPAKYFAHWCNLMGDPTMEVFIGIPKVFTLNAPSSLPVGSTSVDVTITDNTRLPVQNACVTVNQGVTIISRAYTDAQGRAYLPFNSALTAGDVTITVSKHNYKPLQTSITVNNNGSLVSGLILIDDDNIGNSIGNGNSAANSGERLEILYSLQNTTSNIINNISGFITTNNPYVTLIDSTLVYGSILPSNTSFNLLPILAYVSPQTPNNTLIRLTMSLTDDTNTQYNIPVYLTVTNANLSFVSGQIIDSNNSVLDPGEIVGYNITLTNTGTIPITNLNAVLYSNNDLVEVVDTLGFFGDVAVGTQSTSMANNFQLHGRNLLLPGMIIPMRLKLYNSNGFLQWINFNLTVGVVTQHDPLGPDAYGYVIYDVTDTGYQDCPTYEWVEIVPSLGGQGTLLSITDNGSSGTEGDPNGADALETVTLPFPFTFYGQTYTQITVCSNGFLTIGPSYTANFRNFPIPGAGSPGNIIAPFWDDLSTTGGGVYSWFDAANHRYIVEWYNMKNGYNQSSVETFQVILYDPAFYPTSLGDGPIKIQYQTFNNVDIGTSNTNGLYSTIGIANRDQSIGLQYSFNNQYPTAAAPLSNQKALYITNVPIYYQNAHLVVGNIIINDTNGNQNIEAGESISLGVQLMNIGNVAANSITATLTTTDQYVNIQNAVSNYHSISGDGANYNLNPFTFSVNPNCPHPHTINFMLNITSQNGSWQRPLSFRVEKASLNFVANYINDVAGNNSGIADPNETILIICNVQNNSNVAARNVIGQLSSTNQYAIINSPVVSQSQIDTQDIAQFVFPVTLLPNTPINTYISFTFSAVGDNASSVTQNFSVGCGTSGMNQDFENTNGNFISSSGWTWGVPGQGITAHSGQKVWGTSLTAQYPNGANFSLTTPPMQIGANAQLSFWHILGCENYWDGGNVSISTNGGSTWTVLTPIGGYNYNGNIQSLNEIGYSGTISTWTQAIFNLSTYAGNEIIIRWRFASDTSVTGIGWFIDDVMITGFAIRTGIVSGNVIVNSTINPSMVKIQSQNDYTVYPNADGIYTMYLPAGSYTLTPSLAYHIGNQSPQFNITDTQLQHSYNFSLTYLTEASGLTYSENAELNQLTLSWIAPSNPFYPVIGYRVYRKLGAGNFTMVYQTTNTFYSETLSLSGTYSYFIRTLYNQGEGAPTDTIEIAFPFTENEEEPTPTFVNALYGNYPNPFNPTTTISFSLAKQSKVNLNIYNIKGQLVRTLVNDIKIAGKHKIVWDGNGNDGKRVASGIYLYRLKADKFTASQKMIMLK